MRMQEIVKEGVPSFREKFPTSAGLVMALKQG